MTAENRVEATCIKAEVFAKADLKTTKEINLVIFNNVLILLILNTVLNLKWSYNIDCLIHTNSDIAPWTYLCNDLKYEDRLLVNTCI